MGSEPDTLYISLNYQNFKNSNHILLWTPTLKANLALRNVGTLKPLRENLLNLLTLTTPHPWNHFRWQTVISLTLLPGLNMYLKTIYFKLYGIWVNNWVKSCQYWALKSASCKEEVLWAYPRVIGQHDLKYFLTKLILGIFLGARKSRLVFFKILRLFSYNWQPWNDLSTRCIGYQTPVTLWMLIPFWNEYYFRVFNF